MGRSLFSEAEKSFADVLMKAFHKGKVKVFIKVRVLDVIALDAAEPDKKKLFFSPGCPGRQAFRLRGLPSRDARAAAGGGTGRPDHTTAIGSSR